MLVRFVGQAPIGATVYALEKLRCHLCGEIFTAPRPEGVGPEKYDVTTSANLRYAVRKPAEGTQAVECVNRVSINR